MFKKRRGIHLPYSKQGLIHFMCVNYKDLPKEYQKKILDLCLKTGGEHHAALFALMTNEYKTVVSVSLEYYISETQLYHYRRKFYEAWDVI